MGDLFTERDDYHPTARKMVRSFDMTKDGFTLLPMGFTGPKALQFKPDLSCSRDIGQCLYISDLGSP